MVEIKMPKAGQTMEEGTIVRWLKSVGQPVKKGDVLFELETDKSTIEVEASDNGILEQIVHGEGATVPVLTTIALLRADGQQPASSGQSDAAPKTQCDTLAAAKQTGPAPRPQVASSPQKSAPSASAVASTIPATGERAKASPAARRAARERGMDISAVGAGSGPGGRVVLADVAKAPNGSASSTAVPGAPVRRKLSPMRKAIARNLVASKQTIPHFYVKRTIEAGNLLDFYRSQKERTGCGINDIITFACARLLMEFPAFRSQLDGEDIVEFPSANIGIAVGLDEGLVVPVIVGSERMSLGELGAASKHVAERARGGKLDGAGKGVFTISNMGMFGVDEFTAIINPPESAILAVGAIREEIVVRDGAMRPGRVMTLTLSADHRLIDGVLGAKFLGRLKELLEAPDRLIQA